ncbi:deubiquitinase OTUD6B-like [Lineus longissimus]|uniref:deubiquitinase OTUD6B-like n=1 Tax=Lineus longissimus TaxID=88925 RepID=UPI002B4DE368
MSGITEEDLLTKQKKEKKELQARTTKLKHSIPKGDKKKKKEVTAEIAILEAELEQKHEDELKEFNEPKSDRLVNDVTEKVENLTTTDVPADGPVSERGKKTSKAQKRRDKKAQQEKEREERIMEGEVENLLGDRNVEAEKLKGILQKRGLAIHEVPSDGNCLYTAVVDQLIRLDIQSSVDSLRQQTATHMRENMDDFFPFLTKPETCDPFSREEYEKYCEEVENTPAWGGQLEIRALSNVLKRPMEVIQADGPCVTTGEEYQGQSLLLSYHRHKYGLGEHYNSVIPKVEEEEDEFT